MKLLENFKAKAKAVKRDVSALLIASRRNDIPWYVKALVVVIVAYAMSPVDLIPDFIPVIGYLDDLIIIPLGITLAVRIIPPEVLAECREEAERESAGKKKNWIAGAAITTIWLFVGFLVIKRVFF